MLSFEEQKIDELETENAKLREGLNNLTQLLSEGKWTLDGLVHADVVCIYINSILNGGDDENSRQG